MGPVIKEVTKYLWHLGYGKDSTSIILGIHHSRILSFLKGEGLSRTITDSRILRLKNGVHSIGGKAHYAEVRAELYKKFPGLQDELLSL